MHENKQFFYSDGPQFRVKPQSIEADNGATVTLSCDVDGNPFPDITWYHGDNPKVVSTNPNLTLHVDISTSGRYICKARVSGFPEVQADAYIYRNGPPSIISHKTQFGIEGDNVRVECTAFSIPTPDRVIWTFNGHEIDSHDQNYSILEDPLPEGIKSTLVIRESQERHFGTYNCSVTNRYGSDMVEINLMPQSEYSNFLNNI